MFMFTDLYFNFYFEITGLLPFSNLFCSGVFADVSGAEVTNIDTVNSNVIAIGLMKLSNKMLSVCLMMLQ